MTIMLRENTKQ